MEKNLQKRLLQELLAIIQPFAQLASDENAARFYFQEMGWDVEALLNGSLTPLLTALNSVQQSLDTTKQLLALNSATPTAGFAAVRQALQATNNLFGSLAQLKTLGADSALATVFFKDVLQKMTAIYLFNRSSTLYSVLAVAGAIETDASSLTSNGRLVKGVSNIPVFSFAKLLAFLKNPEQSLAATYWPGGTAEFATVQTTNRVAQLLLPRVAGLLNSLGIPTLPEKDTPTADPATTLATSIRLATTLHVPGADDSIELGLAAGLLAATQQGPGVFLAPYGAATLTSLLGEWMVALELSAEVGGLAITSTGVHLFGAGTRTEGSAAVTITRPADDSQPQVGNQTGTKLQLGGLEVGARLDFTASSHVLDVHASLAESVLSIHPDEGDSFLNRIIPPEGLNLRFSALLGWSSTKGLYFGGRVGLKNTIPLTGVQVAKFLRITSLTTELLLTDRLAVRAAASGEVKLGPVKARVEEVGLSLEVMPAPDGGNAGPFNVALDFKGPRGVGLEVEADVVKGGGYLFLDPANHKYAGVAHLKITAGKASINVNALGILQTQLPDAPDDYSLLLLLTATFAPIQLGLGFTLSGLGGILGVNRQADVEFLRGMVRQGQLRQLLFTDDIMDDPAAALALVESAFPATPGRYVVGLMAQLGWGAGNLLTLDAALLVELPTPVRVLLLGVLQAVLPSPANPKLRLRADFLGVLDFGAKKISFDATLSGSSLLGFTLTGDLAFRFYYGSDPLFVLTAGGFHPAFQPPAGAALIGLKRLTLGFSQGGLQCSLATYFALTSNTVQFGAHLDVLYVIGYGFRVEGHFGFDVLFQFSPFRLLAHVEAGVAIKRGDTEYLSLHLALDVTGPGPWHIWGEASFRILFVKISVSVNAYAGASGQNENTLPAPNVHQLVLAALREPASWQVEAPATPALPGGIVLRPVENVAGQVFLDPRGALSLRQRVAPLGVQLDRYGNTSTAPVGGRRFELAHFKLGNDTYAPGNTSAPLEDTRDFFAPAQFYNYASDGDKLSAPSFQSLPNGLRLKSLDGLLAGPYPTRRVIEYEKKLLSGASGGSQRVAATTGTADTTGITGTMTSTQAISATTYRRLSQGGALGRETRQAQPSARAAQPVGWQLDTYEVVLADTLQVYDAAHAAFKSQLEADLYCRSQTGQDPTRELLVVPTYQATLALA